MPSPNNQLNAKGSFAGVLWFMVDTELPVQRALGEIEKIAFGDFFILTSIVVQVSRVHPFAAHSCTVSVPGN